jgi:hypothetical protein
LLGPFQIIQPAEVAFQPLPRPEDKGAHSLALGRGRNLALHRQVGENGAHVWRTQGGWMSLAMEADEALDPVDVGLFGADAVGFEAELLADAIESVGLWSIRLPPYNY